MVIKKLSDLPSKTKYEAGDRLIAHVSVNLLDQQINNIVRAIQKWAGSEVRVLVVNCSEIKIVQGRNGKPISEIAGLSHIQNQTDFPGIANISTSKVDIRDDDTLVVFVPRIQSDLHEKRIKKWIQEWSGKNTEIRIEERPIH